MKTIFRFVKMGLVVSALAVVGATAALAQDPCADSAGQTALDAKFRENYDKDLAKRKIAVQAGKEFLEKYGTCAPAQEFSDYLKTAVPQIEEGIKKEEALNAAKALYGRFDKAVVAKNWDEAFASVREIAAQYPDNSLDQIITVASIGYDQAYAKNNKYNDETLRLAKQAISMIESGKTSKRYGLFGTWEYKTKENALGWMNLTVGYITYYANKNKKDALPYLYKASQATSDTKSNPLVFEAIGGFYFDEVSKLAEEVKTMIADQKDTDPDDVKAKKEADIKAKIALLNGYAERAIDAYARAHKVTKDTPAEVKAYKDGLYKTIQSLYNVRFAKTDGVDAFIASLVSRPMPDPTSTVAPIIEEPKATDTTTGGDTAMATTTPAAKPAAAPAKKPVVKKKGTR